LTSVSSEQENSEIVFNSIIFSDMTLLRFASLRRELGRILQIG